MNLGNSTRRAGTALPDPFSIPGRDVSELLNRVFEFPAPRRLAGSWVPAATVWEDEDSYHVDLELPGVQHDQVEVSFDEGRLLVTAKRPKPEGTQRYHHDERSWGETTRAFSLPESVDPDSIDANLHGGVLAVTLVKRPEVLPRKIEVKTQG